jgi:hypothetical protein
VCPCCRQFCGVRLFLGQLHAYTWTASRPQLSAGLALRLHCQRSMSFRKPSADQVIEWLLSATEGCLFQPRLLPDGSHLLSQPINWPGLLACALEYRIVISMNLHTVFTTHVPTPPPQPLPMVTCKLAERPWLQGVSRGARRQRRNPRRYGKHSNAHAGLARAQVQGYLPSVEVRPHCLDGISSGATCSEGSAAKEAGEHAPAGFEWRQEANGQPCDGAGRQSGDGGLAVAVCAVRVGHVRDKNEPECCAGISLNMKGTDAAQPAQVPHNCSETSLSDTTSSLACHAPAVAFRSDGAAVPHQDTVSASAVASPGSRSDILRVQDWAGALPARTKSILTDISDQIAVEGIGKCSRAVCAGAQENSFASSCSNNECGSSLKIIRECPNTSMPQGSRRGQDRFFGLGRAEQWVAALQWWCPGRQLAREAIHSCPGNRGAQLGSHHGQTASDPGHAADKAEKSQQRHSSHSSRREQGPFALGSCPADAQTQPGSRLQSARSRSPAQARALTSMHNDGTYRNQHSGAHVECTRCGSTTGATPEAAQQPSSAAADTDAYERPDTNGSKAQFASVSVHGSAGQTHKETTLRRILRPESNVLFHANVHANAEPVWHVLRADAISCYPCAPCLLSGCRSRMHLTVSNCRGS